MHAAGRERAGVAAPSSKAHNTRTEAGDGHGDGARDGRIVPQLAVGIAAPALRPARTRERAIETATPSEAQKTWTLTANGHGNRAVVGRVVPELAAIIQPSALHDAPARDPTGMIRTCHERRRRVATALRARGKPEVARRSTSTGPARRLAVVRHRTRDRIV